MTTPTNDFFKVVDERHSVKKYDASHKMTKEEIKELLETTQKAPSSWNLQQWKFLVIEDQAYKEKALPIAFGQQQVADASITVCLLADLEGNKNAEPVFSDAVEKGFMPSDVKDTLINQIEGAYSHPGVGKDQGILNASLAAMQLMLTAKAMGYDTCPMGGFDKKKLIKEFDIPERYLPIMLITVGKAKEEAYPSTRFSVEETTVWNSF